MSERADRIGIWLIVGYKLTKAVAEVLLGLLLLALGSAGLGEGLHTLTMTLRYHAAEAWSIELSERLVRAATGRHVLVVSVAMLLDGPS